MKNYNCWYLSYASLRLEQQRCCPVPMWATCVTPVCHLSKTYSQPWRILPQIQVAMMAWKQFQSFDETVCRHYCKWVTRNACLKTIPMRTVWDVYDTMYGEAEGEMLRVHNFVWLFSWRTALSYTQRRRWGLSLLLANFFLTIIITHIMSNEKSIWLCI